MHRRKNFLPTVLVTLVLWGLWALVFYFVPPETFGIPYLFLLITFLGVLFPSAMLLANTRRGLFVALFVILVMILSFFNLGNYLNILLSLGIFLALEFYLSTK